MRLDWNEFLQALPREERLITQRLREIVLETEPRLVEKMNYRVPYYIRNKQICFIWPISAPDAPKAKNQKADGTLVSFGLCYGNLLSNEQGLLLSEGRKQVYIIRLRSFQELTKLEKHIVEIIQEAVLVDEQAAVPKKSIRKKKN
jgi:hypothetical protein